MMDRTNLLLSLVIPIYKVEPYIEKCLSRYFLKNKKVTISLTCKISIWFRESPDHKQ